MLLFIIKYLLILSIILISSNSIHHPYGRTNTAHNIIVDYSKKENNINFLKGRIYIVTGANAGIGTETVKALASAGARVILCSRDIDKGKDAIKNEIKKKGHGNYIVNDTSNIIVKQLDLSSFDSIKKFAKEIINSEKRIDGLILNAGIMSLPSLRIQNDCELQMLTNHIGHAALTRLLLPKIKKNKKNNPKIIYLSSSAHRFGNKNIMKDLNYKKTRYISFVAYGQSKLANLLYAKGLSKHLEDSGYKQICVCSVHPGVITSTQLFKQSVGTRIFSLFPGDRNMAQGAASTIYACLSEPEALKGQFIFDCRNTIPNANGRNEILRDEVWKVTENILDKNL